MERGGNRMPGVLLGVCLVPSVLLPLLQVAGGAPLGQGLYPMPASILQALSSRGTLVLEAALRSALLALERALAEHQQQRRACGLCAPCLFHPCANLTRHCPPPAMPRTVLPSCQDLLDAQALPELPQRNWALSQACALYQHLCPPEGSKHACTLLSARLCRHRLQECRVAAVGPDAPVEAAMPGTGTSWLGQWWWVTMSWASWTQASGQCPSGASCLIPSLIPRHFMGTWRCWSWQCHWPRPPPSAPYACPVALWSPALAPPATLQAGGHSTKVPCPAEGPAADVVMEARVPLLSQETCRGALGRDLLTSTMFCAGYLSGGIDSCQGDSGGPLACQDPSSHRFILYGITSWGDGCGERGKPGVYTRVAAFADWLKLQMDPAPGSREPSCFDLLALAQLPHEQQPSERTRLCAFYTGSCQGQAACARLAEETCRARTRRCELHAYAQTLLNLLRQAGDFIRNQFDFSFLTRALPQLLGKIYGHLFPPRVRRDAPGPAVAEGQPSPMAKGPQRHPNRQGASQPPPFSGLFRTMGPHLQDWVEALRTMMEGSPPAPTPDRGQLPGETWLFLQGKEVVEELVGQGRAFLTQLRAELDLSIPLEAMESQRAPGELSGNLSASLAESALREKRELVPTEMPGVEEEEERGTSKACPSLNESVMRVSVVRELYAWVLRVPESNLAMTFQEILVDLGSKNAKGLYRAQVRATVGGRPTAFTGLVGLESDSLARSMPGLVALALEALKT
ncbi:serine protease 56 isoform X2 [Cuculus canorus]|uniref:serine protease 56 isoform X2 n=1 Tax=Cuculus canorus TaxID=55661 RepID=UPI0023AA404A|nr:serine protease 56 isoform X2 [Cuculus canorus]